MFRTFLVGFLFVLLPNFGYAGGSLKSKAVMAVVSKVQKMTVKNTSNKVTKSQRLRSLMHDTKIGRAERGWIKQEVNAIKRSLHTKKPRIHIRNPLGFDLAHRIGKESAKGYSYKYADLKPRALHIARHKVDNYGRKNK
jgi:hypothetical protein